MVSPAYSCHDHTAAGEDSLLRGRCCVVRWGPRRSSVVVDAPAARARSGITPCATGETATSAVCGCCRRLPTALVCGFPSLIFIHLSFSLRQGERWELAPSTLRRSDAHQRRSLHVPLSRLREETGSLRPCQTQPARRREFTPLVEAVREGRLLARGGAFPSA